MKTFKLLIKALVRWFRRKPLVTVGKRGRYKTLQQALEAGENNIFILDQLDKESITINNDHCFLHNVNISG